MKISDTVDVLTKIAAFDRRTLGDADVAAWHDVIGDLEREDAMEAVRRHYLSSREWIMPADVRRLAAEVARPRLAGRWAPGMYGVTREEGEQIAREIEAGTGRPDGVDRSEDIRGFAARWRRREQVAAETLAAGHAALHPRRAYWTREHELYQRQQATPPNPHYDPEAAERLRCWMQDEERQTPPVLS